MWVFWGLYKALCVHWWRQLGFCSVSPFPRASPSRLLAAVVSMLRGTARCLMSGCCLWKMHIPLATTHRATHRPLPLHLYRSCLPVQICPVPRHSPSWGFSSLPCLGEVPGGVEVKGKSQHKYCPSLRALAIGNETRSGMPWSFF